MVLVKKKDHEQLADGDQRTLQEEGLAAVQIPGSMEDPISYKETALQTEQIDQDKIPMLHCPVESAFVHYFLPISQEIPDFPETGNMSGNGKM